MVDHPVLHAVVVVVVAAVPGGQHLDAPCKQCTPNKSYTDGTKLGKIIEERFIHYASLRGVHHPEESSFAKCITLRSQALGCALGWSVEFFFDRTEQVN